MKTFIKWAGNKSVYASQIVSYFPSEFNTYIEPFVGSGAVLLRLMPKTWTINDKSAYLMEIWNAARKNYDAFVKDYKILAAEFLRLSTKKDQLSFCREKTEQLKRMKNKDPKRAALYLFLKNAVYMGFLHTKMGLVFDGFDMNLYTSREPYFVSDKFLSNLKMVHDYVSSSKGKILNKDYKKVLEVAKPGDFVFLDPPYQESHSYKFKYNDNDAPLTEDFVKELLAEVKKLDARGVKWMMTQANTPLVRKTFSEYRIRAFKVYRRQSRTYKNELMIFNY